MAKVVRKNPSVFKRLYLAWYLSARKSWIVVFAAWSIVSFGLLVLRLVQSGSLELAQVGAVLGGLGGLALALMRARRNLDAAGVTAEPYLPAAFEMFLSRVGLAAELERSGYTIVVGGVAKDIVTQLPFEAASAVSARVNRVLWDISAPGRFSFDTRAVKEANPFKRLVDAHAKWPLPEISRLLLYPLLKARARSDLANEGKIRLCEDLFFTRREDPILIQRTDYLSDVATGQATGIRFRDSSGTPYYNGLDFAFEQSLDVWRLRSCRTSSCSNQIGVSSLAVAVSEVEHQAERVLQGHVFVVIQGAGSVQSPGLLAPSGSGSLDWSDYTDYGGEFVYAGMQRELFEETAHKEAWAELLDRGHAYTLLTGFGRMVHRGGKPEFYGLVVMPRKRHERSIDGTEEPHVAGFDDIEVSPLTAAGLATKLAEYRNINARRLSHPLFMALKLAEEYLEAQPAHFDAMVGKAGAYWRSAPAEPSGRIGDGSAHAA